MLIIYTGWDRDSCAFGHPQKSQNISGTDNWFMGIKEGQSIFIIKIQNILIVFLMCYNFNGIMEK